MKAASRRTLWMAVQSALYCAIVSASAIAQQSEPATSPVDDKADRTDAERILVTGSRLPASISAMPQSVLLIDKEEVAKQIVLSSTLSEILANLVPGISRSTGTSGNSYTAVRGRKPVFLIDGAPITSTLNDTAREVNLIDPRSIERIEVVPGSSALYGNSAGAGFVNYVTKGGAPGPLNMRTEIGAGVSTTDFSKDATSPSIRQTFSGTVDRLDYRVSGGYERLGDFVDANGNVIPPTLGSAMQNSTIKSAFAKVGYGFGRQRIEGSVSYYSHVADIEWASVAGNIATRTPGTAVRAVQQPGQVPEEHEALVSNLVYSNSAILGTSSSFRAQAFYVDTTSWFEYSVNRFVNFTGSLRNGQSGNMTKKTGARFDVNTPLRALAPMDGTVLWGFDLLRDKTKIPLVDGRQFGIGQTIEGVAGFVQLQFSPFRDLKVSAGVRREVSDLKIIDYVSVFTLARITGGTIEFKTTPKNAGAVYSLTRSIDLYGGFSQGFDIQQTSLAFRAWPVNINLAETKPPPNIIDSYEAGVRFHGHDARASLGVYQLESSKGISYVFNPAAPNEPRPVVAPDKVKGVEMTLDYTGIDRWSMGMTYARSTGLADADNNGSLETPLQNRRIPPPSFTGHVEYEFAPGSRVRVQGLFSRERNAFPNTVPGRQHEGRVYPFNTIDLIGTFKLRRNIDLSVAFRNLFNKDYFTNSAEGFNVNANYLKAQGRTLSIRLGVDY